MRRESVIGVAAVIWRTAVAAREIPSNIELSERRDERSANECIISDSTNHADCRWALESKVG